ncbi:CEBPD [Branchiostoma lanceolatum]|uniref:CEBPD protein n=1 Tax=Branchiostoma lanceolatum TaxID=7740 RepID=A0A8J9YXD7_BRALA|nr:CEBPD [Branchiostoma lanceolatum]
MTIVVDELVGTSSLSDGTKCVEDITELTDCNGDLTEFLSGDLAGQMLDMEDFLDFTDLSQFMGMVGAGESTEGEEATDVTANAGTPMLFPVEDNPPTEAAIPQASTSDEPPMKMARLSASESIPSSPGPSPAEPPIDRRRKNNVAAQVSRRKRKEREANMEQKAVELEAANAKLREKVAQLEQATTEMKQRLIQSLAFGK